MTEQNKINHQQQEEALKISPRRSRIVFFSDINQDAAAQQSSGKKLIDYSKLRATTSTDASIATTASSRRQHYPGAANALSPIRLDTTFDSSSKVSSGARAKRSSVAMDKVNFEFRIPQSVMEAWRQRAEREANPWTVRSQKCLKS